MLYKPTTKDILHERKEIVEHVIPIIKAQGFVLALFKDPTAANIKALGTFMNSAVYMVRNYRRYPSPSSAMNDGYKSRWPYLN